MNSQILLITERNDVMGLFSRLFGRKKHKQTIPQPAKEKPFVSVFDIQMAQFAEEDRRAAEEAASYARSSFMRSTNSHYLHTQQHLDAQMHAQMQIDHMNQMQQMEQMHQMSQMNQMNNFF